MEFIGEFNVLPQLPKPIIRLNDLANNFYFAWHKDAQDAFREIDPDLWRDCNHNPVKFLRSVSQKRLEEVGKDTDYLQKLDDVLYGFDKYMTTESTWFNVKYPEYKNKLVAYFSAEYGFHESLPIYSGGLGILAGDHCKSASDLGLPMVGIGLAYHQAYFTQRIDATGKQTAEYPVYNFHELPVTLEKDKNSKTMIITIELAGKEVSAQIWRAQIGRIPVFLLDTNISRNDADSRQLTARLYGGDQEMRISQEILLGIGGVRALRALGYKPDAWHMNEGHSVFLGLRRIREYVENEGLNFYDALEAVTANNIFTTHTPVPAGNDAFPLTLKEKYFRDYWESVKIKRHEFMELGTEVQPAGYQIFSLTILAFNTARFSNGVSRLHQKISRKLWESVWPDVPENELPIDYVTNGIHAFSWIGREMGELFRKYLGKEWVRKLWDPEFWDKLDEVPAEALWETKIALKKKMIQHLHRRMKEQYERNGMGVLQTRKIGNILDPNALIIGFARRFATYKRATLLFRDRERLIKLLNNPDRPVQIIFAGKAHPKDEPGQNLIRQIWELSQEEPFKGKIFIVDGYDINMARHLIAGTDVWLNTPRRPHEASGTSGQKVPMNGGINLSVLDGWWVEGYNGKNGWAFGDGEVHDNHELHDTLDSIELYELLENEIIPAFFNKNDKGISDEWIQIMLESMKSNIPVFTTSRMVKDYIEKLYIPAINNNEKVTADNFQVAKELSKWKQKIERAWSAVSLTLEDQKVENGSDLLKYGEKFEVSLMANLGDLKPEDVLVEIYLSRPFMKESDDILTTIPMKVTEDLGGGKYQYKGFIEPKDSGLFKFTARVIPSHPKLTHKHETKMIKWVE